MKPHKMPKETRDQILKILEDQMRDFAEKATKGTVPDYWYGRIDGLNDAFRLIDTGDIRT